MLHHFSPVPKYPVSPGNPCPILRALVSHGLYNEKKEPIGYATQLLLRFAQSGEGTPSLNPFLAPIILFIANGIGFQPFIDNLFLGKGLRINQLRQGPLYKHGVSSRMIDSDGKFVEAEFERYSTPSPFLDGLSSLYALCNSYFQRATRARRSPRTAIRNLVMI